VRVITFTGSAKAGWAIRAKAGTKRVLLELGGNAAVIVEPDADLTWAAARCAVGGFTYAGQSCISTQRIYVHESVYAPFLDAFTRRVQQLKGRRCARRAHRCRADDRARCGGAGRALIAEAVAGSQD